MAQPATVTVTSIMKPDLTRRKKYYKYAITMADPGAPTYPLGGIVVNLSYSNVGNAGSWERHAWSSPALPKNNEVTPDGNLSSGYLLSLQQNSVAPTMLNYVLRIWTVAGTELAANAAIPAALFAALIANAPQLIFSLRGSNYGS